MTDTVENLAQIDPAVGFKHFPLGLTPAAAVLLDQMMIAANGAYDNFGELEGVRADCTVFFQRLGNIAPVAETQAVVVANLAARILAGFAAQTAWLTIRATKPSEVFNMPRWHRDGHYYEPHDAPQVKAVFAPKGPGTLLATVTDAQRRALDARDSRAEAVALIDPAMITVTPQDYGTAFLVGAEQGTYHSEPPLPVDRLFLSIVPGDAKQIEELRCRWMRESKASFWIEEDGHKRRLQALRPATTPAVPTPNP